MSDAEHTQIIRDQIGSCVTRPGIFFLGGSGRLGGLLRRGWHSGAMPALWHARQRGSGDVAFDPLRPGGDKLFVNALQGVDVLVNLAGPARQGGDETGTTVHEALALATLDAAHRAGVGAVFLMSSAAVYGAPNGRASESGPAVPVSAYGRAKLEMENTAARWCDQAGGNAPAVTCLRLGNVAGADMLLGGHRNGKQVTLDLIDGEIALRRSYLGPRALASIMDRLAKRAAEGQKLPFLLNVALRGSVRMDDLLLAAGIGWVARRAPQGTIADVTLDTIRLEGCIGKVADADACEIVVDWQNLSEPLAAPQVKKP